MTILTALSRPLISKRSNHPKSRKAIVTYSKNINNAASSLSSNHPKSRKAIVTFDVFHSRFPLFCGSNHPKSRKAIVTTIIQPHNMRSKVNKFQSPQKPKGDCDRSAPHRRSAERPEFQSPQKPKGDCDNAGIRECSRNVCPRSNHPKSRKAIVTYIKFKPIRLQIIRFQSPQKPKGDCDYFTLLCIRIRG